MTTKDNVVKLIADAQNLRKQIDELERQIADRRLVWADDHRDDGVA